MYSTLNRSHVTQSHETTITVAPSGADYTTIKAAIAYATAHATAALWYRIRVANGTYNLQRDPDHRG